MTRQTVAVVLLVTGAVAFLFGTTWRHWHSPQLFWGPEQAREYTDSYMALKAVATSGIRRAVPKTDPKLLAAQARFDISKAKLEQAATLNRYSGRVITALGVGFFIAGAWLLRSHRAAK